jgi:RNA polymerase sigma-70 factor (ECF subfamily)
MVKSSPAELKARYDAIVEEYGKFLRDAIAQACPRDLGLDFDDIEQEARLRLWRAIESEREIRDLSSYVYRIAVTTTIDSLRKASARREEQLSADDDESPILQVESADASPEQIVVERQVLEKIEQALARLPKNRRRAVALYLEGMTSHEIAEILDWSEPKARNLLYRGLKDLRKQLRAAGIEYE